MVKLIAIDMDGTLLNSQKEIPQENIAVIQFSWTFTFAIAYF